MMSEGSLRFKNSRAYILEGFLRPRLFLSRGGGGRGGIQFNIGILLKCIFNLQATLQVSVIW